VKYVAPTYQGDAFNCPHCEAYAHQMWPGQTLFRKGSSYVRLANISVSICQRCQKHAVWVYGKMVYPGSSSAPLPVEDIPDDVKADFIEARNIVNASPRAAAALLRLALQRLMPHLEEKGENLNDDIGNLVKKGLPEKIRKALDAVRVIGNNQVHPGVIDLRDDPETATALFELLNAIIEHMISEPKKIDELYGKIPESAKKAIKKRDGTI